jgi:hypothetical protein
VSLFLWEHLFRVAGLLVRPSLLFGDLSTKLSTVFYYTGYYFAFVPNAIIRLALFLWRVLCFMVGDLGVTARDLADPLVSVLWSPLQLAIGYADHLTNQTGLVVSVFCLLAVVGSFYRRRIIHFLVHHRVVAQAESLGVVLLVIVLFALTR